MQNREKYCKLILKVVLKKCLGFFIYFFKRFIPIDEYFHGTDMKTTETFQKPCLCGYI